MQLEANTRGCVMANSTKPRKNLVETRDVPNWFPVAGFACIAAFIVFLMALILLKVQIGDNKMLVVFLLAVTLAAGGGFIGGNQAAKGTFPFPFARDNPIEFSLVGGGAIFIVALMAGYWTYARVQDGDPCKATYQRGIEYLAGNHINDAVSAFSEVVTKCPTDIEGWRGRSRAYTQLGQYDEAFKDAQQALILNPNDPALRFNVALLYLQLNNNSKAIEMFGALLDETPGDVDAQYNLALAYQRTGNFEDAKRHYESVIQRNGELTESATFNLAAAYAERSNSCGSSDTTQAIELLRKSLELAAKEGQTDLRVRRISGKVVTENGEKFEKIRSCKAFRNLLAEAVKTTN